MNMDATFRIENVSENKTTIHVYDQKTDEFVADIGRGEKSVPLKMEGGLPVGLMFRSSTELDNIEREYPVPTKEMDRAVIRELEIERLKSKVRGLKKKVKKLKKRAKVIEKRMEPKTFDAPDHGAAFDTLAFSQATATGE